MIGKTIGPYQILAELGRGGMGEVYRAKDTRLDRDVAIKVLPESLASDLSRRDRFEREARAVAALSHPNIVNIYDTGLHEGHPFVVMELLDGETLRAKLDAAALPPSKAIDYARQVATGLAAAHAKGIAPRETLSRAVFHAHGMERINSESWG